MNNNLFHQRDYTQIEFYDTKKTEISKNAQRRLR